MLFVIWPLHFRQLKNLLQCVLSYIRTNAHTDAHWEQCNTSRTPFNATLHFTLHFILHYTLFNATLYFTLHFILRYTLVYVTSYITLHFILSCTSNLHYTLFNERYKTLGQFAPNSNQRSAFMSIVRKVTFMLSLVSACAVLRLILLGKYICTYVYYMRDKFFLLVITIIFIFAYRYIYVHVCSYVYLCIYVYMHL